MDSKLLGLLKIALNMFLLFFVQFSISQNKITDEKLLQLVDNHIQSPIREIVFENGDVFLQRDMSKIASSITATRKYNNKNELVATINEDAGCKHNDSAIADFLNSPQPSVKTMEKYFTQAANDFKVPIEILKAMGQIQSNWAQAPVSMYGSYGVMGLIEFENVKQISLALSLVKIPKESIIKDATHSIPNSKLI
jgi:hypothetical protein